MEEVIAGVNKLPRADTETRLIDKSYLAVTKVRVAKSKDEFRAESAERMQT